MKENLGNYIHFKKAVGNLCDTIQLILVRLVTQTKFDFIHIQR